MLHDDQTPIDTEQAQQQSEQIDTASGPGPVLDQDRPTAMPIFNENERAGREATSLIDPEEWTELNRRDGDELDAIAPIDDE